MDASQPSRTAQGAAMHRAAHQLLDAPPVFVDPLALAVVGSEAAMELRTGSEWQGASSTGLRAFIAARSRLAEDTLADAFTRGVEQYVLLGAGLDTFAYRASAAYPTLKVFEIDHPATQAWKRERLAEVHIAVLDNVTYVPVNFETDTLVDGLKRGGFDFSRPAVLAWLGVTPYLSPETVMDTLRTIAHTMQPGSQIVFDYTQPLSNMTADQRANFAAMAERVASLGEPFRSAFEPGPLAREVAAAGFSAVDDFDVEALNARYFADREDGLKLRGRAHLMRARV
jgi:methyltransferase (TIGR00027 family)